MKRRTVLQAALAGTAALTLPRAARAQTPRKLSYLTWNIADQEQLFKEEFADFRAANPGVEIEWLDKKAPSCRLSIRLNSSPARRRTWAIYRAQYGASTRGTAGRSTSRRTRGRSQGSPS